MNKIVITLATAVVFAVGGAAHAKIPVPQSTPEQAAKAAEAKAKAAEGAKTAAEQLGKAQDRAADNYKKGKGKAVANAASAPAKK